MRFGEQVRARRRDLKLRTIDAAHRAGVTPYYWTTVEIGRIPNPSLERAIRIAAALNTTIEELAAIDETAQT